MWICPACDAVNEEDARFCTNCGRRRSSVPNRAPARAKRAGSSGGLGLWLVLVVLLLACTAMLLVLLWQRNDRPEPTPRPIPTATAEPAVIGTPEPEAQSIPVQVQTPTPQAAFSGYLEDAAQLDEQNLQQLCAVMEETVRRNVNDTWQPEEHLERSSYVGFFLLKAREPDTQPRNILILIYRNDVNIRIPSERVNKSLSYYYTLRFENVRRSEDGRLALPTPFGPDGRVLANVPKHYFYYDGYESLEELRRELVTPCLGQYSVSESWA